MTATELYLNSKPIIKKKVYQYIRYRPWVEPEEFESQANLTFVKCLNSYDPEKASFQTHLSRSLDYDLTRYLKFFALEWTELYDVFLSEQLFEENVQFKFWLKSLSIKTQRIVETVLYMPISKIENPRTGRISRKSIRNYFHCDCGWSLSEIQHCFNEISLALEKI
jgi:hypothetical protein